MKLSIVITTRDRYEDLISCLTSITVSINIKFKYEIIVVDDNSIDKTINLDNDHFKFNYFKIIHNNEQKMMVKSRNIGAKIAHGELILFIDDDNIIDNNMISKLVLEADENPEYGILGPKMSYYPNKKPYLSSQKINLYTGKTSGKIIHSSNSIINSDGIPNVFMVRKKVLDECGFFDEKIVQTYTEPDLAFAARKIGYLCGVVNNAHTYHKNPVIRSSVHYGGNQFYQKAFFLMRNRTVMVVRYGKWYQQIIYLIIFSLFWPISYSILVLKEKRIDLIKLYWLGYVAGIKFFFTRNLPNPDEIINELKIILKYK